MPLLIIKVDTVEGQADISVTEITEQQLEFLNPLITEIKSRQGYFPTGDYFIPFKMESLEVTYCRFQKELKYLDDILPFPDSGHRKITEMILVPDGNWLTLKMSNY